MPPPIVVVGIGNMGSVFSTGFLSTGYPVYPVLLGMDMAQAAAKFPDPLLVLVAVSEDDLHTTLGSLPDQWKDRVGLLQNELMPRDWEMHSIANPTVAAAWFEKRKTTAPMLYFPTPVYGPHAGVIEGALNALDLPTFRIDTREQLVFELVRKNLYIVTKNIVGLVGKKPTVGEVWAAHPNIFMEAAREVLAIQEWLAGEPLPGERLLEHMVQDIEQQPEKGSAGSSAPRRLSRMLGYAAEAGIDTPRLRAIQQTLT